jgi:hypothetical protein
MRNVCRVGRASCGPCTATITELLCFPFYLPLYQPHAPNELRDFTYGGVTSLHKKLAEVTKPQNYSLTVTEDMCGRLELPNLHTSAKNQVKENEIDWACRTHGGEEYI